jgi:hypothetical protein
LSKPVANGLLAAGKGGTAMNATVLELGLLGDVGTLAWARRGDGLLTDSERRRYIAAAVAESARLMPPLGGAAA